MGKRFVEMVTYSCNQLKYMKSFTLSIALLICGSVSAQLNIDSLRQQYKSKTMMVSNGIVIDGYRIGKTEVQNLMVISPEAGNYYKLYLKNSKPATILPFVGLAASVAGLFIRKNDRTTSLILIISGGVVNGIGSIFKAAANHNLHRAVWTYNRDVLYPVK